MLDAWVGCEVLSCCCCVCMSEPLLISMEDAPKAIPWQNPCALSGHSLYVDQQHGSSLGPKKFILLLTALKISKKWKQSKKKFLNIIYVATSPIDLTLLKSPQERVVFLILTFNNRDGGIW